VTQYVFDKLELSLSYKVVLPPVMVIPVVLP